MSLIFIILFSDIGQCFHPAIKNSVDRNQQAGHVRIKQDNTLLLVNILGLYISCCRLQMRYRLQTTTDRIPKLPTDIHFLFLSDSCLYMVHLGLV